MNHWKLRIEDVRANLCSIAAGHRYGNRMFEAWVLGRQH